MLSTQQQAVIDWAINGKGSLNLVARAGCGKTFTAIETVIEITKAFPTDEIVMLAYNKSIAVEIKDRLMTRLADAGIEYDWKRHAAATVHSLGFGLWKRHMTNKSKTAVNARKVADIIDGYIEKANQAQASEIEAMAQQVAQTVSLAKQRAFGILENIDNDAAWWNIVSHFDIEMTDDFDPEHFVKFCKVVYKKSISLDYEQVDFDDMIIAPLIHGVKIWSKNWVIIDEAQDTNPARRALAKAVAGKHGRVIAIGDPAQAIYGFTGADSDSMDILRRELGSVELPLNQTYRCPKAVVQYAQQFVPDIEALPEAPEGSVESLSDQTIFEVATKDDAILCRTNAPLIGLAYQFFAKGIACRVEGREIGEGLKKLAQRWKIKTTDALLNKLDVYQERETKKALAKGQEMRAEQIEDQVAVLRIIIAEVNKTEDKTVAAVCAQIDTMFGDNVEDVLTLASIHKSKGREWPTVYWLNKEETCPSKWAKQDWQREQEQNLMYVAATRAENRLIFFNIAKGEG